MPERLLFVRKQINISAVLNDVSAFSKASQMLVLSRYQVVDIDTMDDFKVAERLFKISRDL